MQNALIERENLESEEDNVPRGDDAPVPVAEPPHLINLQSVRHGGFSQSHHHLPHLSDGTGASGDNEELLRRLAEQLESMLAEIHSALGHQTTAGHDLHRITSNTTSSSTGPNISFLSSRFDKSSSPVIRVGNSSGSATPILRPGETMRRMPVGDRLAAAVHALRGGQTSRRGAHPGVPVRASPTAPVAERGDRGAGAGGVGNGKDGIGGTIRGIQVANIARAAVAVRRASIAMVQNDAPGRLPVARGVGRPLNPTPSPPMRPAQPRLSDMNEDERQTLLRDVNEGDIAYA